MVPAVWSASWMITACAIWFLKTAGRRSDENMETNQVQKVVVLNMPSKLWINKGGDHETK